MGPEQVLPLQLKMKMGVMTMKGYSTLLKALRLESDHQMV